MIITRAPLRVSFFGGGTDFPEYYQFQGGGAVLATAIDKYSYVFLNQFSQGIQENQIKVAYSQIEVVDSVEFIKHPVYRECLKAFGIHSGLEIHTVADLPAYTGLGSSSSFTVALVSALSEFKNQSFSKNKIAAEAIRIERDVLKEAVGCQDQTIAAFGGLALIEFNSDGSITRSDVAISKKQLEFFNESFTLVYTGIQRRAALIEVDKMKNLSANQENLSALRKMAYAGKKLLERGDCFKEFGEMLHEAWMRKRCLSDNVSNVAIDTIYEDGLTCGAFGGKLLGAGAGGFILFCHDHKKRDDFRLGMQKYKVVDIKFVESGVKIIANV